MQYPKLAVLAVLAPTLWACSSGSPVNIGENHPAKTGESLSDYAASWDGYAEAYTFNSGSDRVQIHLDAQGNGSALFGEGTSPPPATDADAFYPPSSDGTSSPETSTNYSESQDTYEGFSFTVQKAIVADRWLQLGINPLEVFKSWCELQTPVLDVTSPPDAPRYDCMGAWHSGAMEDDKCRVYYVDDPATDHPISCAKFQLCGWDHVCDCTADGCTAGGVDAVDHAAVQLDAALEDGGASLVGTLKLSQRVTVRLASK